MASKAGAMKTKWLIFRKCNLLNIKGNMGVSINDEKVARQPTQKDLGLIVSSLSCKDNFNRRTKKATIALHQIKRNLPNTCRLNARLNAFVGYVVPTLVYGSHSWAPNEHNRESSSLCRKGLQNGYWATGGPIKRPIKRDWNNSNCYRSLITLSCTTYCILYRFWKENTTVLWI